MLISTNMNESYQCHHMKILFEEVMHERNGRRIISMTGKPLGLQKKNFFSELEISTNMVNLHFKRKGFDICRIFHYSVATAH